MHSILTTTDLILLIDITDLNHVKTQLPAHFLGTHSAKACSRKDCINFKQINKERVKSVHRGINPHLNTPSSIKPAEENSCLPSLANLS